MEGEDFEERGSSEVETEKNNHKAARKQSEKRRSQNGKGIVNWSGAVDTS